MIDSAGLTFIIISGKLIMKPFPNAYRPLPDGRLLGACTAFLWLPGRRVAAPLEDRTYGLAEGFTGHSIDGPPSSLYLANATAREVSSRAAR